MALSPKPAAPEPVVQIMAGSSAGLADQVKRDGAMFDVSPRSGTTRYCGGDKDHHREEVCPILGATLRRLQPTGLFGREQVTHLNLLKNP